MTVAGKRTPAAVLNPAGSLTALETDLVKRLQKEGRPILIPDLFQTGIARPRPGDIAVEHGMKLSESPKALTTKKQLTLQPATQSFSRST